MILKNFSFSEVLVTCNPLIYLVETGLITKCEMMLLDYKVFFVTLYSSTEKKCWGRKYNKLGPLVFFLHLSPDYTSDN